MISVTSMRLVGFAGKWPVRAADPPAARLVEIQEQVLADNHAKFRRPASSGRVLDLYSVWPSHGRDEVDLPAVSSALHVTSAVLHFSLLISVSCCAAL